MTIEELSKLSDEELRVRCAELCGITMVECTCGRIAKDATTNKHILDYPADLNAMHEAWLSLDDYQKNRFQEKLQRVCLATAEENSWLVAATARQRCIAFIATKQLS